MKLFATLCLAVIMILTGGCASAPAVVTDAQYTETSIQWYLLNKCPSIGMMPVDVAARGLNAMQHRMTMNSYDQRRVQANVQELSVYTPTQEQCNYMAMMVHRHIQQADATDRMLRSQQEEGDRFIEMTKIPRPVYCNKIGTTTVCN